MTKNRARTPVYLDPGMHLGLEVKGLSRRRSRTIINYYNKSSKTSFRNNDLLLYKSSIVELVKLICIGCQLSFAFSRSYS